MKTRNITCSRTTQERINGQEFRYPPITVDGLSLNTRSHSRPTHDANDLGSCSFKSLLPKIQADVGWLKCAASVLECSE